MIVTKYINNDDDKHIIKQNHVLENKLIIVFEQLIMIKRHSFKYQLDEQ